ncbi:Protein of unknown function [Bacillus toyonensis]|nr:Protein of unknown function [Bacillus toyonensis]
MQSEIYLVDGHETAT